MSGVCQITNNDLVLYLSVLIVLVLIFPLLDLLILRVAWIYKGDFWKVDPITKQGSYLPRTRTASSLSNRAQHVHPMQRTTATLIFSNEELPMSEELRDSLQSQEESIVYGRSLPRHLSIRGAEIEDTSRFIRSAEEVHFRTKIAEKAVLPQIPRGRLAKKIEALPAIETPAIREVSFRKRTEKVSVSRDTSEDMYGADNDLVGRVTLVSPVTTTAFQSSEFLERLTRASLFNQETKRAFNVDSNSKSNLIEVSSRDSTPVLGDRKLLSRPDNTRRKVNRLGTTQSPSTSPK